MAKKVRRSKRTGGSNRSNGTRRPVRTAISELKIGKPEEGPGDWFLQQIEETYTRLSPTGTALPEAPAGSVFRGRYAPAAGEAILARPSKSLWRDVLSEYRKRKAAAITRARVRAPVGMAPPAPAIPGGRNWRPLGPKVVLEGQTVGDNPVAGRVSGIAVTPGGDTLYVATAAGGVFRSDDLGASWTSCMDGFDVDPTDFASASLACGAIAIDSNDPDRVYVGTGEGDTHAMFQHRVINALPAYRGIGPIRSDDGGQTWHTEHCEPSSPDLAGDAFFALAVDPGDRENVVGATTVGLYQRVSAGSGNFHWVRRRTGIYSDVVVATSGATTRFFAARWGGGVFHSTQGGNWLSTGTGFPTANVSRVSIGVQSNNPNLVYAFVSDTAGDAHGLYRLDSMSGAWRNIGNVPPVLHGQGDYNLTIAVDPNDDGIVYLGGDHMGSSPWAGSVWRCKIRRQGTGYRISESVQIGTHAHADVHKLLHSPGDSSELWCGCDGGLFLNRDPSGSGQFASRNEGLSCLCSNFIAQHPTDPNILMTGLQDNGTAHTANGPTWKHVSWGDGGYCLINWNNPNRVMVFMNGTILISSTGGDSHAAWSHDVTFGWATMTQPIVSPPYNPAHPNEANVVAAAAGEDVWISTNFGTTWTSNFSLFPGERVFALAFAGPQRIFAGTTAGRVYRADKSANHWTVTRIDNSATGPLGLTGLITDVAVDWADSTGDSIYICFGGLGDDRRVWHFDGTMWAARHGATTGTRLLDVEHNALIVDRAQPNNIYVGADIGVWHSKDSGTSWNPLQNGLPDAPVFDLQIHPTQRLLRAATHGRGVYEIRLD